MNKDCRREETRRKSKVRADERDRCIHLAAGGRSVLGVQSVRFGSRLSRAQLRRVIAGSLRAA